MTQKEAHNTTTGYDNTALYNVKLPKQERKEKKIIWIPKKTVNPTDAQQSARLQLPKENPEPSVHLHPVRNASTAEDRKPKETVRTTKRRKESKVLKQQNKLLTRATPQTWFVWVLLITARPPYSLPPSGHWCTPQTALGQRKCPRQATIGQHQYALQAALGQHQCTLWGALGQHWYTLQVAPGQHRCTLQTALGQRRCTPRAAAVAPY